MVRLGSPSVNLDGIPQSDHQELYPLVFDDLEMHGAVQVSHVDPTTPSVHLLKSNVTMSPIILKVQKYKKCTYV